MIRSGALISGVTIRNGSALGSEGNGGNGGGVFIWQDYNTNPAADPLVTIDHTVIISNTAAAGGGVYAWGKLLVTHSRIERNHAVDRLRGGGGIFNDWRLTSIDDPSLVVGNTQIAENTSVSHGAGVLIACSSVKIQGSTLDSNTSAADSCGGALVQYCSQGKLRVVDSTISRNQAGDCAGIQAGGELLEVVNSTISGNISASIYGGSEAGGINGFAAQNILKNVTIANNQTDAGGGLKGNFTIANTILSYNLPYNCDNTISMSSQGHNLSSDWSCPLNQPDNQQGTNPQLAALGDNRGPTETHALLPESPAIDAAGQANCPTLDQRGLLRPADGDEDGTAVCDIGAFEYAAKMPTVTAILSDQPDPSYLGQSVMVSFTVTSTWGMPTGSVTVTLDTGPESCSGALLAGAGSCLIAPQKWGATLLSATYTEDDSFGRSISPGETHTVLALVRLFLPLIR